MKTLGLTGSIGMGKTATAVMLRRLGVWVHDADATVHRLLARGGRAVSRIEAVFPGVVADGAVDRAALGARVFGDGPALRALEAILHPMVRDAERRFVQRARRARRKLVVLDIPLLFETGGEKRCDAVAVVTAPGFLQEQRVLKRPGMTISKLKQILSRQMPDWEKRRKADFLLQTGMGRRPVLRTLVRLVNTLADTSKGQV